MEVVEENGKDYHKIFGLMRRMEFMDGFLGVK